jgi:hypothetical protein
MSISKQLKKAKVSNNGICFAFSNTHPSYKFSTKKNKGLFESLFNTCSEKVKSFFNTAVVAISIAGSFSIAHSGEVSKKMANNLFVSAGTTGGSISYLRDVSSKFGFKLDAYGTGNVTQKVKKDNSRYDLEMNNKGFGLAGYIKPFEGNFRVEAGAYYIEQSMSGVYSLGAGSGSFGGESYNISSNSTIAINMRQKNGVKPYLGIGWSADVLSNVTLNFDAGAMYVGKFSVASVERTSGASSITESAINAEVAEVENNLNQFGGFWPVLKFGIGVKF